MEQPEQEQAIKKASKLRILFRLAFICNTFFIICMIMRYTNAPTYIPQPLIELSIILGWLAPVINFINFVLALILPSRIKNKFVPLWLFYINIICFLLQIYFFFILKDVPHT